MNHVLFIDDEPNILKTLRRQLYSEPYEQSFVSSAQEGLNLIRETEFGVIVSDMRMPLVTGIEVLSEATRICPRTRRVILTGYSELNSVITAINSARVHAYLVKPWLESELKAKILEELTAYSASLKEASRVEQLEGQAKQTRKKIGELKRLVSYDPLTGLHNRRSFETRFIQEWRRAIREHDNLALVIMDIDKFKLVNDTAGHDQGDRILSALADCFSACLQRPADFVSRFGGEEFVAILPNTSSPLFVAEKLRLAVEKLAIPHPALEASKVVTISVGVSACNPSHDNIIKPGDLLHSADEAMYISKWKGGNCVTFSPLLNGHDANAE